MVVVVVWERREGAGAGVVKQCPGAPNPGWQERRGERGELSGGTGGIGGGRDVDGVVGLELEEDGGL